MFALFDLSSTYKMKLAEQSIVLLQMREAACRLEQPAAVAALDAALAELAPARELERAYERQLARPSGSRAAYDLDKTIDAQVGIVHDMLVALGRRSDRADLKQAALKLAADAFPRGLKRHVGATFREQAGLNEGLVGLLREPRHAGLVASSGLSAIVDELDALNRRFVQLVAPELEIEFAAVVEAREHAEETTLRAVMQVAVLFDGNDREQRRRRHEILLPFLHLMAAIKETYRKRDARARKRAEVQAASAALGASVTPPPLAALQVNGIVSPDAT